MLWLERGLRQVSVGKRVAIAGTVLVLPMTVLILLSVSVLKRQEADIQRSVDESIHMLLPLATLEYDLQRAQTDDIAAQSGETVPDYSGLTSSIDRLIAQLDNESGTTDLPQADVRSAQVAWQSARPVIQQLIEHVAPVRVTGGEKALQSAKKDLSQALRDVEYARHRLGALVKSRTSHTISVQQHQIRVLVLAWACTLMASLLIVGAVVYSIVRPTRELGRGVRQLISGDLNVRIDASSRDELGVVATYLNAMARRFSLRRNALEEEARRDALTGLANRRALEIALEATLSTDRLVDSPVSVLMIDVDFFKKINDQFGHQAGDQALVWLTKTMQKCFRENDFLGRYAGDEFLAILPETSAAQALVVANRLCELVRQGADPSLGRPTVTVGVATTDQNHQSAEAVLQAADQALYRAKEAGRGLVFQSSGVSG